MRPRGERVDSFDEAADVRARGDAVGVVKSVTPVDGRLIDDTVVALRCLPWSLLMWQVLR